MTIFRSTSQIAQVLLDADTALRSTSQIVQALLDADPALRSTLQVVQVLYSEASGDTKYLVADITASATVGALLSTTTDLTVSLTGSGNVIASLTYTAALTADIVGSGNVAADLAFVPKQLVSAITASATVTAVLVSILYDYLEVEIDTSAAVTVGLEIPELKVALSGSGFLTADITGIRQLTASIDTAVIVGANLDAIVNLTAAVTGSGNVNVDIRKNTEYLTADIAAGVDITLAELNVPWHPGNTVIELAQEVIALTVLVQLLESTLNLQQTLELRFGQRSLTASNTIVFTQSAIVKHVLPTKTATSTLSLAQALVPSREAESQLELTQAVVGTIVFIEGIASSSLNLTDSATLPGSVFNLVSTSQLNLTHLVVTGAVRTLLVSSSFNLHQNAFPVILASKKYVLLQAPFGLIQTSIVLPNPLFGDTENLLSDLKIRRSMDNTVYTYVKTVKGRRLKYTFTLNRLKALELEAFFDAYNGADIKVLNWKGEVWKVNLITNPIDFVQTRRAEPGGDRTDVNVEFEGVLLNG